MAQAFRYRARVARCDGGARVRVFVHVFVLAACTTRPVAEREPSAVHVPPARSTASVETTEHDGAAPPATTVPPETEPAPAPSSGPQPDAGSAAPAPVKRGSSTDGWSPRDGYHCFPRARVARAPMLALGCGTPPAALVASVCALCALSLHGEMTETERAKRRDACCYTTVGDY